MPDPFAPLLAPAARVAERLVATGATVAVAESSTGGLVTAALLAVPGASRYLRGGAVIYTATARRALLGIEPSQLGQIRSASESYASLLAETVRARHDATWGLGESGVAGPTGNGHGDPAGHTCLAVAGPQARTHTLRTGTDDRVANMGAFALALIELFAAALE